jgi:propanediol dehydratase large subunit
MAGCGKGQADAAVPNATALPDDSPARGSTNAACTPAEQAHTAAQRSAPTTLTSAGAAAAVADDGDETVIAMFVSSSAGFLPIPTGRGKTFARADTNEA